MSSQIERIIERINNSWVDVYVNTKASLQEEKIALTRSIAEFVAETLHNEEIEEMLEDVEKFSTRMKSVIKELRGDVVEVLRDEEVDATQVPETASAASVSGDVISSRRAEQGIAKIDTGDIVSFTTSTGEKVHGQVVYCNQDGYDVKTEKFVTYPLPFLGKREKEMTKEEADASANVMVQTLAGASSGGILKQSVIFLIGGERQESPTTLSVLEKVNREHAIIFPQGSDLMFTKGRTPTEDEWNEYLEKAKKTPLPCGDASFPSLRTYTPLGNDNIGDVVLGPFEQKGIPYPRGFVQEGSDGENHIFRGPSSVKLNKMFVRADDPTLKLLEPEKVKAIFTPLVNRLKALFKDLVFRRVFAVDVAETYGEPRLFSYVKDEAAAIAKGPSHPPTRYGGEFFTKLSTPEQYDSAVPHSSSSNEKNFQKNEELAFKKRYLQEKGRYHGFTNKRALRAGEQYDGKSIYFNTRCYNELDCINKGTWEWFRPDNDKVYQLPYQGELVCGLVKIGDKGPYYEKWFLCSEQFLKLVTLVLDPTHESIEGTRARLASRLKCNKFGVWIGSDEGKAASQAEIEERYHRNRYEQGSLHPYMYMWIGLIACLGDDDVELANEGKSILMQMAHFFVESTPGQVATN